MINIETSCSECSYVIEFSPEPQNEEHGWYHCEKALKLTEEGLINKLFPDFDEIFWNDGKDCPYWKSKKTTLTKEIEENDPPNYRGIVNNSSNYESITIKEETAKLRGSYE